MDLHDQVIVVAGHHGALAKSYIEAASSLGATVVFCSRPDEQAYSLVAALESSGVQLQHIAGELQHANGAAQIIEQVIADHQQIDAMFNVSADCTAGADDGEDIAGAMDRTFYFSYHLVSAVLPHMKARRYGRIVNTTSGIGVFGSAEKTAFAAASAAVVGFTKSVALEVKDLNIHVNAIAPYAIHLAQDAPEIPRSESEMVAPVVAYLSHAQCQLSGEIITVGRGRVSRLFTNTGPGYLNFAAQIDDFAENLDIVTSTKSAVTPLRAEDEMLLVDV